MALWSSGYLPYPYADATFRSGSLRIATRMPINDLGRDGQLEPTWHEY